MAISAPASADHGPASEVHEDARGHAGRNGAWSENVTSCVGEDGTVYHRNLEKRADRDGETTRDRRSGNPAACHRDLGSDPGGADAGSSSRAGNGDAVVSTGDITVAPGDIVVLSPPATSGNGEPEPAPRARNSTR